MTLVEPKMLPSRGSQEDVVLSVQNVSKRFCRDLKRSLAYGVQDICREILCLRKEVTSLRTDEFWALDDISFELRRGESVGLVGRNGAGKTTLLRIISGLINPDAGSVEVIGRVAPLIALGAGFNPILTGRENVYANMSILGLSKKEISERFSQVIEFAEIGDAIDAPVQTYSSGMAARLGFASAIYTEPELLLVDEVLAVGDARFQSKCTRKLAQLKSKGTSFLLVSHSSSLVLSSCQKAVYLLKGKMQAFGEANSVVQRYESELFQQTVGENGGKHVIPLRPGTERSALRMTYALFRNASGEVIEAPRTGESVSLCIGCEVKEPLEKLVPYINVQDLNSRSNLEFHSIWEFGSHYDQVYLSAVPGEVEFRIDIETFGLCAGRYNAWIAIHSYPLPNSLDYYQAFTFVVKPPEFSLATARNLFYQPRSWSLCQVS
ncbi:MAG: ABC transporter ATP-binding protein [Cyanobacteria bacterium J06632_3]